MKFFKALKQRWVVWVWNHTPNCVEMTRLTSDSFERSHSLGMRMRMRLHHLICVWCERYHRHLKFLHRVAPQLQDRVEHASHRHLSEESKRRMIERLRDGHHH